MKPDVTTMAWDDDFADEEWVDDQDESGNDLLVCASCRGAVHEDTQQCPHCGDWINPVYPGGSTKRWVVAIIVTLLVLVLSGVMLL